MCDIISMIVELNTQQGSNVVTLSERIGVMKRVLSAFLAVFMIFSLCSCSNKKKTVLVISGTEINNEIFTYFLDKVVQRPIAYNLPENPLKEDLKEAAINECKQYIAANTEFMDMGLKLSSAEKVEISQNVNDFWVRFENHYKKIGVSKQTLTKILTSQAYEDAVFAAEYDKGTGDAAAETVLQNYFYENYISFRTVCAYFTSADGSTNMTQAEKTQLLASFDALAKNAGADVDKFAETVQASGYTLSDTVLLKKGSEGYPDGFFEKVYAQDDNTVQIIVYDECVFAIWKENLKEKGESVYVNYRSACISDLYSAQAQAKSDEYIRTLTVEEKGNRIDRIIKDMT